MHQWNKVLYLLKHGIKFSLCQLKCPVQQRLSNNWRHRGVVPPTVGPVRVTQDARGAATITNSCCTYILSIGVKPSAPVPHDFVDQCPQPPSLVTNHAPPPADLPRVVSSAATHVKPAVPAQAHTAYGAVHARQPSLFLLGPCAPVKPAAWILFIDPTLALPESLILARFDLFVGHINNAVRPHWTDIQPSALAWATLYPLGTRAQIIYATSFCSFCK